MAKLFRVSADIYMTAGALAGITIPAGWSIGRLTADQAMSYADWLDERHCSGTEVESISSSYRVASYARVEPYREGV